MPKKIAEGICCASSFDVLKTTSSSNQVRVSFGKGAEKSRTPPKFSAGVVFLCF